MPASNDVYIGKDLPVPKVYYSTNIATLTPITFTTPPPSLTLIERTLKATAKFNAILESELYICYKPI